MKFDKLTCCLGKVRQKSLVAHDKKITALNNKLQKAKDALDACNQMAVSAQMSLDRNPGIAKHSQAMDRALKAKKKAETVYEKAVEASSEVIGKGTGRVGLLLPSTYRRKV